MTPPGKTDGIPIRPGPQDGDGYTHALVLSSHPQPAPAVDQRPGATSTASPAAPPSTSDPRSTPSKAAVDLHPVLHCSHYLGCSSDEGGPTGALRALADAIDAAEDRWRGISD